MDSGPGICCHSFSQSSDGVSISLRMRSRDRKSTRLNSSHLVISYAVFCLKKLTTNSISTSLLTLRSYARAHKRVFNQCAALSTALCTHSELYQPNGTTTWQMLAPNLPRLP